MRDYWLSKLFFDLQSSPPLGDEYRASRKKILDRYPLKPEWAFCPACRTETKALGTASPVPEAS